MNHNLTRLVFLCFILAGASRNACAADFAGGTGQPDDPYQIATAEQLISIGVDPNLLDKHFVLLNDIDLDPNRPGGKVFGRAVIAPDLDPGESRFQGATFDGSLDGQGHIVTNLTIEADGSADGWLGLFGKIGNPGSVSRLGVRKARITGGSQSEFVGALAGSSYGVITACYADAAVTGGMYVGGLVGSNCKRIRACYAMGEVIGNRYVGGLVGDNSQLTNCYSVATVNGASLTGGLVGHNCDTVLAGFWDVETSGRTTSYGGEGLTTAQMMDPAMYSLRRWADETNWILDAGNDYPRLVWENTPGEPIPAPVADYFEGSGTPDDPYRIETPAQLDQIRETTTLQNKCYRLVADLDMSGRTYPDAVISTFHGVFDGHGHTIANLTIANHKYGGLFGTLSRTARIENLGLESVTIAGTEFAKRIGMLAGENHGQIRSCYAQGEVTGRRDMGGLVGYNWYDGLIVHCGVTGAVAGFSYAVGGMVGINDGVILDCYACNTVTSGSPPGGLVGNGPGAVLRSYFLDSNEAGGSDNGLGLPLSDADMRQNDSFEGWSFDVQDANQGAGVWFMPANGYPVPIWQTATTGSALVPNITALSLQEAEATVEAAGFAVGNIEYDYDHEIERWHAVLAQPSYAALLGASVDIVVSLGAYDWAENPGDGTDANPYAIETTGQLESLTDHPELWDKHFMLVDDLDLAGRVYDNALIAMDVNDSYAYLQGTPFSGCFDGAGHAISNLSIVSARHAYDVGLFGEVGEEGRVQNLVLDTVRVCSRRAGSLSLGLLAGLNRGALIDCDVSGELIAMPGQCWRVGGLAGENAGNVDGCCAEVLLNGYESVGGVVGWNDGRVSGSVAAGLICGDGRYIGGLAGRNYGILDECLSESTVQGDEHVGGLAGNNNGTVRLCNAGAVVRGNYGVGGLAGHNYKDIVDCGAGGTVRGSRDVGGLVGYSEASLEHCWSDAEISGSVKVGGLLGCNEGSVAGCWAGGHVSGLGRAESLGGLVGANYTSGRIRSCYATTRISGSDQATSFGGLVGTNLCTVTHCFWDVEGSGVPTSPAGMGLTTAEMMDATTYSLNGWADDPNWVIDDGQGYPHLASEGKPGQPVPEPALQWLAGDGTAAEPYLIETADQLVRLGIAGILWDRTFTLARDVDLAGRECKAFGLCPGTTFDGVFNGNGHIIRNSTLDTNEVPALRVGMFGYIGSNGRVTRLGLEDATLRCGSGSEAVGMLAGRNNGTVQYCYAK